MSISGSSNIELEQTVQPRMAKIDSTTATSMASTLALLTVQLHSDGIDCTHDDIARTPKGSYLSTET